MFKKIILYTVASISIFIFLLAGHPKFMSFFVNHLHASKSKYFGSDKNNFGDLYAISYLKDFKFKNESFAPDLKRQPDTTTKEIDLWVIGDSFLGNLTPAMGDSILYKTKLQYYYFPGISMGIPKKIVLNSKKKKVLLIERTERFLRIDFVKNKYAANNLKFFDIDTNKAHVADTNFLLTNEIVKNESNFLDNFKLKFKGASITNQNIETILFGYRMFTPLKEMKAGLNYQLFDRVNDLIYLSTDRKNLFFYETIEPKGMLSAYNPFKTEEIDSIVSNLNFIGDSYKKLGFDEVVFSIVPNAVTIVEPTIGIYNDVINKVQNDKNFRYQSIDIYSVFKNAPNRKSFYKNADTHWNGKGFAKWVDVLNIYLQKIADK